MSKTFMATDGSIRVAEVVAALSRALDLSTGQSPGHSVRSCLLGMRIAAEIGVSDEVRSDLFYALLLKDCGCSANASMTFRALASDDLKAKRDLKTTNWTSLGWESLQYALSHIAPGKPFLERAKVLFQLALRSGQHGRESTKVRCERGAQLARLMDLSEVTAVAILSLDEHWNGAGMPDGLRGTRIPILSRIMLLAQTLEVFAATGGPQSAIDVVNDRSGEWFDPDLVKAVNALATRQHLWADLFGEGFYRICLQSEALPKFMTPDGGSLDKICIAFSTIVDAKSPYTFNHSKGVANAAVAMARKLGLSGERTLLLRNAGLLHDLGKLGVSNTILEKPARLDEGEWRVMKQHPADTWNILHSIPGFGAICEVAGSHHEKLDGSGYFRGVTGDRLSIESRILAVADVFDALSAKRPYRDSLPQEQVFEIMRKETPHALDASCLEALEMSGAQSDHTFVDLASLNNHLTDDTPCSRNVGIANTTHAYPVPVGSVVPAP